MQIRSTAGSKLATVLNVCSNSGAWTKVTYSVSKWRGQTSSSGSTTTTTATRPTRRTSCSTTSRSAESQQRLQEEVVAPGGCTVERSGSTRREQLPAAVLAGDVRELFRRRGGAAAPARAPQLSTHDLERQSVQARDPHALPARGALRAARVPELALHPDPAVRAGTRRLTSTLRRTASRRRRRRRADSCSGASTPSATSSNRPTARSSAIAHQPSITCRRRRARATIQNVIARRAGARARRRPGA